MKLAIALLAVCFVSTSYQVQLRAHYVPLYYADGLPAGYDVVDLGKAAQMRNNAPVKRLLGNLLPSNLLPSLPPISPPITLTSTTTEVATSTITTVKVVNCIPTSLFTASDSTNACTAAARRRRGIEVLEEELNPSAIQPVEPTTVADETAFGEVAASAEIVSSKNEETEIAYPMMMQARAGSLTTNKVVTVVSTTTEFAATTVTSTRLIAAASGLLCLPSGYAVCQ